jgi:hypothetical protein
MKKLSLISMLVLFSVFFSGCISYWIFPEDREVSANEEFTVDVVLDRCLGPFEVWGEEVSYCSDTSDVYGVAFDLNYDPALLEVMEVDVSKSVLSGATVRTGFRNSDVENGKLVVGISKQGQVSGETGEGLVATITFRAKAAGTTDLVFDDPHLIDSKGRFYVGWPTFQAGLHSGMVTVLP